MTRTSANNLCQRILSELVRWPAFDIAIQCAGVEEKARGQYADAVSKWLLAQDRQQWAVVPEYKPPGHRKTIDLSVLRSRIDIQTRYRIKVHSIFETKFNYAKQCGTVAAVGIELNRRLGYADNQRKNAVRQARIYRDLVGARSGYVVYVIAAPYRKKKPPKHIRIKGDLHSVDGGWRYVDVGIQATKLSSAIDVITQLVGNYDPPCRIIGQHKIDAQSKTNPRRCALYCCVIKV